MPRESSEAQSVARIVPIREPRIRVPADVPEPVQAEFFRIVNAAAADHFRQTDDALLVRYCETLLLLRDPKLTVGEFCQLTRLQAQLAGKLRLCPSARTRPETVARSKAKPRSYYEIDT